MKGLLFYANFAGGLLTAFGMWRAKAWDWTLGTLVAARAFVGYVVSCTVGIFGLSPPLRVLSSCSLTNSAKVRGPLPKILRRPAAA